jgi:cyanophycinase-like exopeptidase
MAIVSVRSADTDAEQLLADLEDLGAQAGYLVDLFSEDDVALYDTLAGASVVVISGEDLATNVRSVMMGAAIEGIQTAFENGAVVLVEGPGGMAFGAWVVTDYSEVTAGLDWLPGTLVFPGTERVAEVPVVKMLLAAQPSALAIGVGAGSAVALGPDGQVELLGQQQVTIALGPDFGA